MKQIWSRLKPYLRWVVLGITLFFLGKAVKDHWQEVLAIRVPASGWIWLAIALGVTLLAHTWAGWVWYWILREFRQSVSGRWLIQVYLQTNLAKYLPGNVWHYYGRVTALTHANIPLGIATLSVLLEPLLMAAAALIIALLSIQQLGAINSVLWVQGWQFLGLAIVLLIMHPKSLNFALRYLAKIKGKAAKSSDDSTANPQSAIAFTIKQYPLRPLLGELLFVGLRGTGFLCTLMVLSSIPASKIVLVFSAFSLAWLLGLVVPGAPGGIGVFEATAIALLSQHIAPGVLISSVALYRLISVLAEASGAALAWLDTTWRTQHQRLP